MPHKKRMGRKMSDKEERPNIVDMKQWKKTAEKKAEAEKKASAKSGPRMSNALIQRLAIAILVLVVLWFAMPKGYLNTLLASLTGG